MSELYVRPDLRAEIGAVSLDAQRLLQWGENIAAAAPANAVYREKEGRKTLRFEQGDRHFFLKCHSGVGWREIFKNLVRARLPVVSARNEYVAIQALAKNGINTQSVAAYVAKGYNPATRRSLIVTDELTGTVSLQEYCATWLACPPPARDRIRLIREVARIARVMHAAGINHRDFYLCHFHLDPASVQQTSLRCFLIDLHRAQLRHTTPFRWRQKDLAGLYFSAMDCGLTPRDLMRFVHYYSEGGLRRSLEENAGLWRAVAKRAAWEYQRAGRYRASVTSGANPDD